MSYDCTKATFTVEKVVCGNPSLSTLDDQLAQAYKNARATSANLDQLKNDQIAWIKSNRLCEANVACIENSYKSRITALGGAVTPKAAELPKPAPKTALPSNQAPAASAAATSNEQLGSKIAECAGWFWAVHFAMRDDGSDSDSHSLEMMKAGNDSLGIATKLIGKTKASEFFAIGIREYNQNKWNVGYLWPRLKSKRDGCLDYVENNESQLGKALGIKP